MKNKELIRTIKFTLFSCSAGIIQMGSFALLNELAHLDYWLSYLIALVLSVVWNFTLNRKFTFKSANNVPIAMLKVFGYYCVFTPLSTLLEKYLTTNLLWNEYLVTAINMVLNFVTEYLFDTYVVFRGSIDSAVKKDNGEVNDDDLSKVSGGVDDRNRDLNVTPEKSELGTTSDDNCLPPEIRSRQ